MEVLAGSPAPSMPALPRRPQSMVASHSGHVAFGGEQQGQVRRAHEIDLMAAEPIDHCNVNDVVRDSMCRGNC